MIKELDDLMTKYKVQSIGNGYIDCIIVERIPDFVEALHESGYFVEAITWWCHCTEINKKSCGCPHGMGGPKSKFYDGWFSEMVCESKTFKIYEHKAVIKYVTEDIKKEAFYSPCLVPGMWIKNASD